MNEFNFSASMNNKKTIIIIGASGYIGRHLVNSLKHLKEVKVKILSRTGTLGFDVTDIVCSLEVVKGSLQEAKTLHGFFEKDSIVVNLVYLWGMGEALNLSVTDNLLEACKFASVKRLIHCSTAAVVGRVPDDIITEKTICKPVTEYGITKLKIEKAIIRESKDHFDSVILRPTSVFGPAGDPIKKLANDLIVGNRFKNYLKSCLFGQRRMNLVHILNVVAAINFFIYRTESSNGEIFIVSDDESLDNNFSDVESLLMKRFDIQRYRFHFSIPTKVLSFLLACLGRNNINTHCNYSTKKLLSFGFKRPVKFESGLKDYVYWYDNTHCKKRDVV